MTKFKANYLDIEQGLHVLRTHFEMCVGAQNEDVVHWAKFLREWARKASLDCGPWCRDLCMDLERVLKQLEKEKAGNFGYEVVHNLLDKASRSLNEEILESLPRYQKA